MDRFLIIRLTSLGDIIHTLPAFAALRKNHPQALIRWAVEAKGKEVLDLVPGIDEVVVIEKGTWKKNIAKVKGRDQVALDFQGLVKSGLLAFLSRARRRVGFSRKNLKEPLASLFYTENSEPIDEERQHVISKNLMLLECLGIRETEYEFPLEIPDQVVRSLHSKLPGLDRRENRRLVLFNVGAGWETKRWFPEKWAQAIRKTALPGAFPLLLWGNEVEKRLAKEVGSKTGIEVAPFLSIKEVVALIRSASLLISGDTFALQVACAWDIPVVALFGPTNPSRNGPFQPRDRIVFQKQDCSPCYRRTCRTLECLKVLSPDEVAAAAMEQWRGDEL